MKKLEFKSPAQVKAHLAKYSASQHKSAAHERMESPKFERMEHRLGKSKIGSRISK